MTWKEFWAKLRLFCSGKKAGGMGGPTGDAHSKGGNGTILDEHLFRCARRKRNGFLAARWRRLSGSFQS